MARFILELPTQLIRQIERVEKNCQDIFGQMTRAGAKAVLAEIEANVPESFRGSDIMSTLCLTKTYKTPTDGGINTKVAFDGYFTNENDVVTPAPLVANVFEYGSSKFEKQPFRRKSFRKDKIEKAMLEKQKELLGM